MRLNRILLSSALVVVALVVQVSVLGPAPPARAPSPTCCC